MNQKIKNIFIIFFSLSLIYSSQNKSFAKEEDLSNIKNIIAQPKSSLFKARIDRVLFSRGIKKFRKIQNTYVINVDKKKGIKNQIQELENSGLFEFVEPDYILDYDRNYIEITKNNLNSDDTNTSTGEEVIPNDTDFDSQYYLKQIMATTAWSTSLGDDVLVAILDSGINANHPDLEGKVTGRNDSDLIDDLGHGTEVAGIVAAKTNNNLGIAGIAWNAQIYSLKVTDENRQASVSTVVEALDAAYKRGAKIIQISLSTNQYSQGLKSAIDLANANGLLVISTSGNTGINELRYPAAFDNVIGVGAVNNENEIESYSTQGTHVDLVAPGTAILTTNSSIPYKQVTGTSFAAPQISGTAALIWAAAPDLTSNEVRDILIQSATDLGNSGRDDYYGYGLLNTEKAVELAKNKSN